MSKFGDDRLEYHIACNVFQQGMECDAAARIIRRELPAFLKSVADRVKQDRNTRAADDWGYSEKKETPFVKHYDHGRGEQGPNDPDCPCRGTTEESSCAWQGCGFCHAAQKIKDPGDNE